jgi:hypothetical protein
MRNLVFIAILGVGIAACGSDDSAATDGGSGDDGAVSPTDATGGDGPGSPDGAHGGDSGHPDGGGGDSAGDGNGGCATGMLACDGGCVPMSGSNCGTCGHTCSATEACQGGICVSTATCPPPPSGVPAQAAAAYTAENNARAAMGIPCASLVDTLDTASADHCAYYAANQGNATCVANPHVEVMSCSMYVAANFWDRDTMAGYAGQPVFEVMAFLGDGMAAVQEWIDTVWHRTPILSPWVRDFGYGGATGCDTMDFGVGATTPDSVTATYPYDGQTGVPTSFDGNEGPTPPAPPNGFPSGYPIHIYVRNGTVTNHTLTLAATPTPIPHVWLAPGDPQTMGLLTDEFVMYANVPLTGQTKYHVHVDATNGSGPVTFDWTFTTQ